MAMERLVVVDNVMTPAGLRTFLRLVDNHSDISQRMRAYVSDYYGEAAHENEPRLAVPSWSR